MKVSNSDGWARDCGECGVITANGTCTQCRKGTSPLKVALRERDEARAEAARLREALEILLSKLDDHSEATPVGYFAENREEARAALKEEKP